MKKKLFFLLPVFFIFLQCKKDDDTPQYVIREYSDQVLVDQSILEEYLQTHTYNYEDFNNDKNLKKSINYFNYLFITNFFTDLYLHLYFGWIQCSN